MVPVRIPSVLVGSSTGMPVASVPSKPGCARLLGDELGHGHEQVDVRGDAAAERLRSDVDAGARAAQALPLDRLVLEVLVAGRLDDQRVAELAALDDGAAACGAETIVSSLGQATVSSRRCSTKSRAGTTLRVSQTEWTTVFISSPQSGQMPQSGGTGLGTSTRGM